MLRYGANVNIAIALFDEAKFKSNGTLSDTLKLANSLYSVNGENIAPFETSNIAYFSMIDGLQLTKIEFDKIYLSTNFREAYATLHHSLKPLLTTGRYGVWGKPKDYEIETLSKVYKLTTEYNLVHTLLEELTETDYQSLINIYDGKVPKKRSKK
jgi:hypothetical protein